MSQHDEQFEELLEEYLDDLEPRPARKRKRSSSDRGLPPDEELLKLAKTYLATQRELWPELVTNGVLPASAKSVLSDMVDGYMQRHRTGLIDGTEIKSHLSELTTVALALFYGRYSCDNSSPTSIMDQLHNALKKAKEDNRFIPWEFVLADYSVSGLDSSRQAYSNVKTLIRLHGCAFDSIYIDDFTRASRDSLEWWRIAAICRSASKRMVGASDGFDLMSQQCDVLISVYGLVSRLFISGLRQKVLRGMLGAARRFTVLGKLPLGFAKKLIRNSDGSPTRRPNGKPLFEPAIEPESAELVQRVFRLYTVKRWSPYKIAIRFNRKKYDNTDTWTESTVKKILRNPAYIGVFIWNKTRKEFDFETEKWIKVPNPRSEWIVNYKPELAIIKMAMWRDTQRLTAKNKKGGRNKSPRSRNQRSATTLLSGTLHCGYCGKELTLCRSAGKYKNLFCSNGRLGVHGCQLTSTKSTRIIEDCVLTYLKDVLLTESAMQNLIRQANAHLAELSERPSVNVSPVQSKLKGIQTKIDRLVNRVANLPDDREEARDSYERQIVLLQRELNALRKELREAQSQNAAPPPPISSDAARRYLEDIREVLNLEIPQAAEAIRQLTGPIEIRQQKVEGKRGASWIASFTPNLPGLLRYVSQQKDYPDSVTLEFLCHGNWITPDTVEFPIERIPKYEQLAPKFKELREAGKTIHEIASAHNIGWQVAYETLRFAETGTRPRWYLADDPVRYQGWEHYQELAPVVSDFRDQYGLDWPDVTEEVKRRTGCEISTVTALRAYEYAHRRETRVAAGIGTNFHPRSGTEKFERFRELVDQGITNGAELARRIGVSRNTANRWKKKLA